MKFTLSWLKDYLETDADLETITGKLTAIGLEIEEVTNPAETLAPFVIAEIVEAAPHPDADKLQVCKVNTGREVLQVVCGAPNARTGLKGAFAPSGATIPTSGLKLRPTKIRGVESNGMMCSERELGLGDDHDGIIDLPADAPVGQSFAAYAGLDDPVIEIAITPNRQDALGVYGIARDLAAAGLGTLKIPQPAPVPASGESPIKVHLGAPEACPVFAGRYIRGVKNGPSPDWLQQRLKAIGLRPISALVDITNYLTYDRARPLHVYDADRLKGDIRVRLSQAGETLEALDDASYTLDEGACVITDDNGVIGLGGIIGGMSTGCDTDTVNVFLECAWFDPVITAMTGRRLGIESDARYRFERGVDPETVLSGIEQATRMILELCGGEASDVYLAGDVPDLTKTVNLRPERVRDLGGVDVSPDEVKAILSRLGFQVTDKGQTLEVVTPSWRADIDGEADLVEEVLRIHGFEHIPSTPLPKPGRVISTGLSPLQKRVRIAKRAAAARGLREAVTWSFLPSSQAKLFADLKPELVLENPISADLDAMRPNLLPNLITAAGRNVDRGVKNVALFEAGHQFADDTSQGQHLVLAGVRRGQTGERHWAVKPENVDVFDAKADAEAILRAIGAKIDNAQVVAEAPAWYHPGRSGVIRLGPKNALAYFGELHPRILKQLDVKGPLVGFEILLENIPLPKAKAGTSRGPLKASDFQAVERDFAFVVGHDVTAAQLMRAAASADKKLIENISVFDVYEGPGVADGKKSVALSLRLQPRDRTLTDEEIEQLSAKVIAAVEKATGGQLR
ncbi:phenylalanine--tRNA ligase subunit beta [Luteithermobacter gelatinilyticus]|uniref:phenylalanine--tRNA ligase subunit beta n=1 Tax=Luteithermobacter gelatinilyticus TaxID=2582913 RepID=UPI001105B9E4|nr:phenylalanine--tRNA ligase subunit beta [Luteithermobacter gelatinilyticus]